MAQRIAIFLAGILAACAVLFAASPQKPKNATQAAGLNNLGAAYMNQQLFEKALKAFQDAASLDPKLQIARLNQGIALLNLGKVDAARPLLDEAVKQNAIDPHAWYNLGLLFKNSGDAKAAIEAFRHVTEIDPGDADSWYFLGATYAENRQYPEAMGAFEHALKLNPQHASAEFGLSRAYQQSGDLSRARQHLVRFQYIMQNKLGLPISLAYGEQGKYSLAEESPLAPEKVPEQIKVRFVDVTKQVGLPITRPAGTGGNPMLRLGTGACWIDYDGDGRIDLFVAGKGLFHNLGGKFEDVTRHAGVEINATACAVGDYDNDGAPDLAVTAGTHLRLYHNEKDGTFKDLAENAGLKQEWFQEAPLFTDYDHDGDLDLFVTRFMDEAQRDNKRPSPLTYAFSHPPNRMWRNNGNGTFADVTKAAGLEGSAPNLAAIGTDYNNDRAVDLLLTRWRASPVILENPREGRFIQRTPWASDISQFTNAVVALDFDHDGWMDYAFTESDAPGISLWRDEEGKGFKRVPLPMSNWAKAWGLVAFDYDNDGWVDLVAIGETANGKAEVRLFRNLGPSGFKDVSAEVGLSELELDEPRSITVTDFDNDGAADLLITQNLGPAVLLRNEGGNQNHWIRLSLTGLADNKSAIGTKVEVFAGGNRQKFEIAGSSGYLGQNSLQLTVGLGQAKQADVIRMLWPTGVLQDEVNVPADREHKFMEIDRRGSSCPTLFVWDGERYKLVGDMLGAGVVGHWVGPGQRNIPRPIEYVKIPRDSIQEKNGKLSFRFMEPLEEAVYLDQVELLAIDHPADLDVYPNEYFASNPPYPPFKVVFSRDARPPAAATDEHGHNLLPDLLAHRYIGDFEVLPFAGFTKMHSLELDLGESYLGGPLWLLMHGEIEYFSATGMYAADQAGLQPIAPYVEALGANGKWTRVIEDMGFPAGGPRTMTADLTGKLPAGTRRIRISTNLQIYWNDILISRASQDQRVRISSVPLARATLDFHGFPLKIEGRPPGNVQYIYEQASATGPYTRPAGNYTRYGDVLSLLTALDDRLAVFGSGDEAALDFDPAKLPALPSGWVRDYFYAAHGYEKDMDFYAYDFDHVAPLPFGEMGRYPYPGKEFPLDDEHLKYLLEFNTRYMSGNEARGYGFEYRH
ncbi:MAG: FG-GAP-like repeat-containing protein [Terriglobales bacterium]